MLLDSTGKPWLLEAAKETSESDFITVGFWVYCCYSYYYRTIIISIIVNIIAMVAVLILCWWSRLLGCLEGSILGLDRGNYQR